ncbi:MAG: LysR family transcriptional regulator [Leptolyngbya sp. SIO1D8]|nr:LysR family transcriptional regulator [Leptolyngbya sp. SIO1D8]
MEADIELRQIRYFIAVAEELNFTRAAERLQIAQPPLSRQIQSLEKVLQVELLQRTNRRVTLTPAGQFFLSECQQILSHMERSIRMTRRAARGEIGQLIIGFEGSFHNETVLRIIQEFRQQFPDVDLVLQEMSSRQQTKALNQQLIDIGFVDPIVDHSDISLRKLLSEPLVVVLAISHPLANQDSLNLQELEQETWITGQSDKGCGLLIRILESCQQAGFTPNIQQETNDIQMTLGFVASGLGVTLLPISALRSEHSGVTYRTLQPPITQAELAVAWDLKNMSSVLTSFLGIVQLMYQQDED